MDPQDDIRRFEKIMKDLMEGIFGRGRIEVFTPMMSTGNPFSNPMQGDSREPLTEINETKTEVVVTMELPGANKNQIDINATNMSIEISAKIDRVIESGNSRGRSQTSFRKYLTLPEEVDPKTIKARYKNGILEVTMKKTEKEKGTKIKVE
ncbi:MAG: Hsp20/alpha crystallin family protein [Candidatus Altiarchaeota archaeon]|nr:Hsp20/alpha crystallin family protein [Candidatus Altiarchaeota archaeon]